MNFVRSICSFISMFIALSLYSGLGWANAPQLSEYTIRHVQRAYERQVENPRQAIDILNKIDTSRAYDSAYVNRMLGGLYWQTEKPQLAAQHLTASVDSKALSEEELRDTTRMLADILLMQGEHSKAEARYKSLVHLYQSDKDLEWVWFRIAQSQFQQQSWQSVEQSISKQQKYQKSAKLPPNTTPLNMLLSAQLSQKKWKNSLKTTRILREMEPANELWWKQLISLYMILERHSSALITLQQADRAGFGLSEQQLRLMAQLYAQDGVPIKAAQTYARLASLNESEELLAQQATYWQLAKEWEKARESWQLAASKNATYYWQYAVLALQQREYKNAVKAIEQLPKQNSEALLVKVNALEQLGEDQQALEVAKQAHQLRPSNESLGWIKFLTAKVNKSG